MQRRNDNWGWRARFGMFIVSSEAVPEAEWWAMAPSGVSVHAARIDARAPWANWANEPEGKLRLADDLSRGARHFAAMRLDAVVIGHSSSSILGGTNWDQAAIDALAEILPTAVALSTNGLDCSAALRAFEAAHPLLVFPPWFNNDTVAAGLRYFEEAGFEPAGTLRADPGRGWRELPTAELYPQGMGFAQDVESLYRQIRNADADRADSILIAGTGFRCVGIIDALEQDTGLPVVSANQASLWRCLRLCGLRDTITGYGSLLEVA